MRITIDIDGAGEPDETRSSTTSPPRSEASVPLSQIQVAEVHDAGAAPVDLDESGGEDFETEVTYFSDVPGADADAGAAPA